MLILVLSLRICVSTPKNCTTLLLLTLCVFAKFNALAIVVYVCVALSAVMRFLDYLHTAATEILCKELWEAIDIYRYLIAHN